MVLRECADNGLDKFLHQLSIVALVKSIDDDDTWLPQLAEEIPLVCRMNRIDNQFLELMSQGHELGVWIGVDGTLN